MSYEVLVNIGSGQLYAVAYGATGHVESCHGPLDRGEADLVLDTGKAQGAACPVSWARGQSFEGNTWGREDYWNDGSE